MASVVWTKHLKTEQERKDFNDVLGNSSLVLNRLRDILMEEIEVLDRQEGTIDDFKDPAWTHKQAFRNGDRARLRKILDLLNLKRK